MGSFEQNCLMMAVDGGVPFFNGAQVLSIISLVVAKNIWCDLILPFGGTLHFAHPAFAKYDEERLQPRKIVLSAPISTYMIRVEPSACCGEYCPYYYSKCASGCRFGWI